MIARAGLLGPHFQVGHLGGASTANNKARGAGRSIDFAACAFFVDGQPTDTKAMEEMHELAPRWDSDHNVVLVRLKKEFYDAHGDYLRLFATLSAAAVARSDVVLKERGTAPYEKLRGSVQRMRWMAMSGKYRSLSLTARNNAQIAALSR